VLIGRWSVGRLMAFLFWQGDDGESWDADMKAAKRYFSGDDDNHGGWQPGTNGSPEPGAPPPEGVSSSTIVSGLVASRKQDHAVSFLGL